MSATATAPVHRGTSNGNARGSAEDRRRRRLFLLETYTADVEALVLVRVEDQMVLEVLQAGDSAVAMLNRWDNTLTEWAVRQACRCYRCGDLLVDETLTVDRIIPGCKGGKYRRDNIRPACGHCNSETGGRLARKPVKR